MVSKLLRYINRISQNLILPVAISVHSLISPYKENHGYLKVAGLFYSKIKCPTHANPYPIRGTHIKLKILNENKHDTK